MYTIYTFCHEVDDTVDHSPPGVDPYQQLVQWREEVKAMYTGHPQFPVTISLAEHVQRFGIPQEYFQELITGMEMDITNTRYATFQDVYPYCYRVASIVGLICLHVFGTQSPLAKEYAENLGVAFQWTNILRDVSADADRNRLYLPQEDLQQFGYTEGELFAKTLSPAFLELMRFESDRARQYYHKAAEIFSQLPRADRQALIAAEIMRGVYASLLNRITTLNFHVFGPRIRVSSAQRLAIAVMTWFQLSLQNPSRS